MIKTVKIELTQKEAEFFLALREARIFDLRDVDIIMHLNSDCVITDMKRACKPQKDTFVLIYNRKRNLTDTLKKK